MCSVHHVLAICVFICASLVSRTAGAQEKFVQVPTSAQVTTDLAGKAANAVKLGVVRVICTATGIGGTGFLHRSGRIITAAHVVKDCAVDKLVVVTPAGQGYSLAAVAADDPMDLALLTPKVAVPGQALALAPASPPQLGMHVATWGFPGGYDGLTPLLSVGYLAGTQDFPNPPGPAIKRWVINAAFNGGNSGGPVISLEDGTIVGVVSSKLAPLPQNIESILDALSKQQSGFTYEGTKPDGTKVTFTEGQLIGEVLQYLRLQVQLVIGYSVSLDDIYAYLKTNKIEP